MTDAIRVLLVDCDEAFRQDTTAQLALEGLDVESAADIPELMAKVRAAKKEFHVLAIGDIREPASRVDVLLQVRRTYPNLEAVVLTHPDEPARGARTTQQNVFCYVEKPMSAKVLALNLRSAARFGSERQRSLALQTLVAVGQRVGVAESEEQLYEQLYKEACELLPSVDGFLITHYNQPQKEVSFPFCYTHGKREHIASRTGGNSISEYVFEHGEPLLLDYGDKIFREEHGLNPPDHSLGYSASEIVAPMFLEGRIYGTIFVRTLKAGVHYTNEHLQILQTFANQVASTIRNVTQLKEAKELREATAVLAGHRGRDAVLKAIVEGAHKLIDSDFTGLILKEGDGTLRKVHPVKPAQFFDMFGEPRQQGGLTRYVVDTGEPKIIRDTSKERLVKRSVVEAGIRSMLALPLVHGPRVLGVLFTHTMAPQDYDAHDVDLWRAFATQAAAALDRAVEEDKQINDYKRLDRELGALNEQVDLPGTMLHLAAAAKAVFDSDTCRIFYVDPPTGGILDSAWAEGDNKKYHIEQKPRTQGLTQYVLKTKAPYFYPEQAGDGPRPRPELFSMGLQAVASLPLIYGGRIIGVLHCNYFNRQPAFNEHYKNLMETFGTRAAVAMHKARRDRISDVWRGLDRDIFNCTQPRELYDLLTRKAHDVLDADLSIFYPYDPTVTDATPMPLKDAQVRIGELQAPWQPPRGGLRGGVHAEISGKSEALIVNNLDLQDGRYFSNLAQREGIKAFIAVRLQVILPGREKPQLAGLLFLNYRKPAAFEQSDLVDLRYGSELIASGILGLHLQDALQQSSEQRNRQLRALIDIFQASESKSQDLNLDHIAERAGKSLGIDTCTIMEFDTKLGKFTGRGNYGLSHPEFADGTPRLDFKDVYMDQADSRTFIPDVTKDELMRTSEFVKREGIVSTIVYPLLAEGVKLGLFFANFRTPTEPSAEQFESIGLFADVAAHVLHRANLTARLNETEMKLERRLFLVWVSMMDSMWRHSLFQKASSIRNYIATLKKLLGNDPQTPPSPDTALTALADVDRLASDIANAPPRVPHIWEMQSELVPLVPLLQEIVERERQSAALQAIANYSMRVEAEALGGVEVRGYRRWLIYMFETLLQNCYKAMPDGGEIIITGSKQKDWAEIRIRDTGTGVPKAFQDQLFKVVITGERDRPGMGIGSMLAATLAEENQGKIELEKPGPGDTTVLIRLPIAREASRR